MKDLVVAEFEAHRAVAERLAGAVAEPVADAARDLLACLAGGGTVFVCGNGGSAADAQHLAAELVGRYRRERRALPAIALTTDTSALTAIANDYGYHDVFARQVAALVRSGDVLVALSTSGDSENVCRAAEEARRAGATTIALVGRDGGRLATLADRVIRVPSDATPRIQEAHITIIHVLCEMIERGVAP